MKAEDSTSTTLSAADLVAQKALDAILFRAGEAIFSQVSACKIST